MIQSAFKPALTLVVGTCLLLAACGKKPDTKDSTPEVVITPPQTATDAYMEKQDVSCEQNQACPSFITKIVVAKGDKYDYCTGFLTDKDVVVTSTSCLPNLLRLAGSNCSKDVFFFFPKSGNRPAEKVGCSKVLQVSQIDGQDPNYWRDDLSILQLSKPLYGRSVSYSRNGLSNNKSYYTYMVDQQGDYSAIIKRVSCNAVHQNYVNPLASNESSPNAILADCPMTNGGTGAPILDGSIKVRAVVSAPMLKSLRTYLLNSGLLSNGLKEMLHATNLACAPILNDMDTLDIKECSKDLTEAKVDSARIAMLAPSTIFADFQKRLNRSLEDKSKFLKFSVEYATTGDIQNAKISLDCIRSSNDWPHDDKYYRGRYAVDNFELPIISFKRSMDNVGRIQGIVLEKEPQKINMQFQTKVFRNDKSAEVVFFRSASDYTIYPNVPACK